MAGFAMSRAGLDPVRRRLRRQEFRSPTEARIDGRDAVLFSTNDYLGLSARDSVRQRAAEAARRFGAGAGASRLVSGNHELYETLEEAIARFKNKERALVFPTGYMANLGLITALAGRKSTVFMEKRTHASLYDAVVLSRARLLRFGAEDFEGASDPTPPEADFLATDGVFSMDGDLAPLPKLREAAIRRSAQLIVDDAHGTGVVGERGRGAAEHFGVKLELEVGTLSKAVGSVGGFVAGPAALIDKLINEARPLIFSTGLPPAALAASIEAIRLMEREETGRTVLIRRAQETRRRLQEAGFAVPAGRTPIIPIIIGSEKAAVDLSNACLQRGFFVPAIRKPAVPPGRARLRLSLSALHGDSQIEAVIETLVEAGKELSLL